MIHATIIGRLGRDAEPVKSDAGGCSFSVACDQGFGEKKRTNWVRVTVWGKRGVTLQPMLAKGARVAVRGGLETREHEGKTYLELRADEVELLSERSERPTERPAPVYADDETPF